MPHRRRGEPCEPLSTSLSTPSRYPKPEGANRFSEVRMAEAASVVVHLIARATSNRRHFAGETAARLQYPNYRASDIYFNNMLNITVCLQ